MWTYQKRNIKVYFLSFEVLFNILNLKSNTTNFCDCYSWCCFANGFHFLLFVILNCLREKNKKKTDLQARLLSTNDLCLFDRRLTCCKWDRSWPKRKQSETVRIFFCSDLVSVFSLFQYLNKKSFNFHGFRKFLMSAWVWVSEV
jgi:hypothetical protein